MNYEDVEVAVTGAGGFIGSHLVEELVARGAKVTAFLRYTSKGSSGWLDLSPAKSEIRCVFGDIRDADCVREAVRNKQVVFHLAALIGIPYSYDAPQSYVDVNINGTLNVLSQCRAGNVERIVHTSTSEVYGTAITVPIAEHHALQAQSPYAASKIAADKLAESFHAAFGLPVVTIRPFNTYGPRQSLRAIIPTIISQCLIKKPINLGNLSPTRDLNFVSDTVAGFLTAGLADNVTGMAINLGSGREISIGDLARLIITMTGYEGSVIEDPIRMRPSSSEVERLLADSSLANSVLGWSPQVQLEAGLQRTIEWVASRPEMLNEHGYNI